MFRKYLLRKYLIRKVKFDILMIKCIFFFSKVRGCFVFVRFGERLFCRLGYGIFVRLFSVERRVGGISIYFCFFYM